MTDSSPQKHKTCCSSGRNYLREMLSSLRQSRCQQCTLLAFLTKHYCVPKYAFSSVKSVRRMFSVYTPYLLELETTFMHPILLISKPTTGWELFWGQCVCMCFYVPRMCSCVGWCTQLFAVTLVESICSTFYFILFSLVPLLSAIFQQLSLC